MKKPLFWVIFGVVAIFVVVGGLRVRSGKSDTVQEAPAVTSPAVSVKTAREARVSSSTLTFPATVSKESEAKLVAQTSGTIVSDTVILGGKVGLGTPLYRIDTTGTGGINPKTGFESDTIMQAKLALKNAEENYAQAKRVYNNDKTDANKTARDIQKNLRDTARLQYASLLDAHTVKSPIAGVIFTKSASLGDTVSAGQPLATLGAGRTIARFSVSDDVRALLAPRQKIIFSRESGEAIVGFISRIAPVANETSKQFLIEAESTDTEFAGIPSETLLTVSVTLERVGNNDEVLLPLSALAQEQTGTFAFSLEGDRVKKIPVTLRTLYGETAAVAGSFSDDMTFVVSNAKRLSDGATVFIAQ